MALRNAGIQKARAEIVRFFAVLGFFWWIPFNCPAIADSIAKSRWIIGADAGPRFAGDSLSEEQQSATAGTTTNDEVAALVNRQRPTQDGA